MGESDGDAHAVVEAVSAGRVARLSRAGDGKASPRLGD
jgi:hypothetical protein